MSAGIKANSDGSAAIQVGGSDAITITSGLAVSINGGVGGLVAGTAVASTSGTSIDFTGIPSWAKRITVMFAGVSTNGTSLVQIQLGTSSGIVATGYSGYYAFISTSAVRGDTSTTGFPFLSDTAANTFGGNVVICNVSGNTWAASLMVGSAGASTSNTGGGYLALSGVLDRVRITTVGGTNTFDAGTINIMWE